MKELVLPWPERDLVRQLFRYDQDTGVFVRLVRSGQKGKVGDIAGWLDKSGYWRIRFNGKAVMAHRLAWLYWCGEWPEGDIDHMNGVRSDNRLVNLRAVDRSTNIENQRKARADNKLGVQGVRKRNGSYEARIWVKGTSVQIGTFSSLDDAASAYLMQKRLLHLGCTI